MSQPRVKWSHAKRFFESHGFTLRHRGGDVGVDAPDGWPYPVGSGRHTVRIGHTSCSNKGSEVRECYVSRFKSAFGVTRKQLLNA